LQTGIQMFEVKGIDGNKVYILYKSSGFERYKLILKLTDMDQIEICVAAVI